MFRSPGFSVGGSGSPKVQISIDESSSVLLHDGLGSPAPLRFQNAEITLLPTPGNTPSDTWRDEVRDDREIPSDFSITLTRDEVAFGGRYFIVFNALDKQSGIDHYEVMEEPFREFDAFTWGRADAPWIETESPYVLQDQTLNSTIRVKAIDKAGNERIVTLVPDEAIRSISRDRLILIIVVGGIVVLIGALAVYALWKRRQRMSEEQDLSTPIS